MAAGSARRDGAARMKRILIAATALVALVPAQAQDSQPTPELQALDDALPGTLINDPSRMDWSFYGAEQKTRNVQDASIPGGGAAVRVEVPRAGANIYDSGANVPIRRGIAVGRDVTVAFYARTVKSEAPGGKGKIGVRFQQNAAPYAGFGDTVLDIGSEWALYEVTARSDKALPTGQAVVGLQLAGAKQVIEIGQVIVVEGATSIRTTRRVETAAAPDPELPPQLKDKGRMLNDPTNRDWGFYGAGQTTKATVTNVYGRVGTLFSVATAGAAPYASGASVTLNEEIKEGDVLLVAVLARTLSAATPDGQGRLSVRIQKNAAPYDGFLDKPVQVGPNWRLYQFRTQAPMDIAKGAGQLSIQTAAAQQEIEIGPVYVIREEAVLTSSSN